MPGKPVEELQRELGLTRVIKLASNENPLGPSPKAMAVINEGIATLHRYPDGGRLPAAASYGRPLEGVGGTGHSWQWLR